MGFFGGAAQAVASTASSLTRRLSWSESEPNDSYEQELNKEEFDALYVRTLRPPIEHPASQPDEPRHDAMDPFAREHARGIHPSQYSDEEYSDEGDQIADPIAPIAPIVVRAC